MCIECPKCGKPTIAILRGEPHGLSKRDLERAMKQSKSGKVYGFRCLNKQCNFRIRFEKPKSREHAIEWLEKRLRVEMQ